jgi:hypothetical protein
MNKQLSRKLAAFIITVMMFSLLPQLVSAQKYKPCGKGYKYECYYYNDPWGGRGTWFCWCVPNGNGNNGTYNVTSGQSLATNFEMDKPTIISIKIYDAAGRLIKTLANSRMPKGEHHIEWDRKDEQGNAVSAGIYILQFDADIFSDRKKLTVI